jgi:hypothetical protein
MADLKASSSISVEKISVLDERIGDLLFAEIQTPANFRFGDHPDTTWSN